MVATYLVTGASRGIGFELTKQLLARGDEVISAVRDPSKASALQGLPNANKLHIIKVDVEHPESIKVRSLTACYKATIQTYMHVALRSMQPSLAELAAICQQIAFGMYTGGADQDGSY